MKAFFTPVFLLLGLIVFSQVKIGNNVTNVRESSSLELESPTMGLVVTRVANTSVIAHPVNGMIVYDISSKCLKAYENGAWTNCLSNGNNINPSTNGTSIVSSYTCPGVSLGTLYAGLMPSGVTQEITAQVTQIGTYNITAITNGIVFSGSGTFTSTGSQSIVLRATGLPVLPGTYNFVFNTVPACSFSRNILDFSSRGTAVITSFSCDRGTEGALALGINPIGVTQTISAVVAVPGTYAISTTTSKGVTFSGSGTVAAGMQDILLTASGMPTASGLGTFTLNTTPACSFSRTVYYDVAQINWSCNNDNDVLYVNTPATTRKNVTANVVAPGSYSITTNEVNGISYSASGFFNTVGSYSVELIPSGTPQNISSQNSFTLNTLSGCTFNVVTLTDPSTNGTATVSAYTPIGSAPKVLIDTPIVPGIKQYITATVTKTGTYSIQAVAYGLTFAATGSFTAVGAQEVILEAVGTANTKATLTFTTNTLPACSFPVKMYSTANWMEAFPDDTNLSQLTLPGTHDSAAQYEALGTIVGSAKCQELTIAEQLNAGVRFLDIRCCITAGKLRVFHGAIDQQLDFLQVFEFITTFLTNNPTETVMLSIKREGGWISFVGCQTTDEEVATLFRTFMSRYGINWWNTNTQVSTLSQARGKITLMSRVPTLTSGLQAPFEDNTTFSIESPAKLRVQDYYELGNPNNLSLKWSRFSSLLDEAHADTTNRLYLNFASGYVPGTVISSVPDITPVRQYMNPKISDFFDNSAVRGKYGTLLLDYINNDIARKMVKSNFYQFGGN